MLCCVESAAAPAVEPLAEIYRETIIDRRYIEPGTVSVARLQTRDAVLRQKRQKSRVDMRCPVHVEPIPVVGHPDLRVRLCRLFRIGSNRVAQQAQGRQTSVERLIEETFLQR